MSRKKKSGLFRHFGLPLLLCFLAFPSLIRANGKDYPLQGTVAALGTSQETTGGGSSPVFTHTHRTYTVKTSTRIFVLECPYSMDAIRILAPSECGGKRKIQIGDTIHFRIEKSNARLLTAEGKEEKLRVVSEAMNDGDDKAPAPSHRP